MATTMTPIQPGTEATAAALADFIFGSDIPPIDPDDYAGSWRTTLHVIAEEWVGEGRFERHAARTATVLNELVATQKLFGVGSPEALAVGTRLQPLIDRCRHFGITTADLRRHGAQFPVT
ncbi:hypothetical protein GCM10010377_68560 [Streptomyces viridiviolaceus]|uniref:Uncharacterized protein n=1 Tax=Streptomyces viridiviolaceus TaxID=68282 RepID=A0ABW2EB97_9ACTN|nr:hypothetical protein [Streptomyces viridiviolaceus]GHB67931.1 hypothetical protein GCM10010377_68560 [Streptomyces viridiviolaceus]